MQQHQVDPQQAYLTTLKQEKATAQREQKAARDAYYRQRNTIREEMSLLKSVKDLPSPLPQEKLVASLLDQLNGAILYEHCHTPTRELMKEMEKEAPRQRTIKTLVKGGADLYSQPTDNKWPPLLKAITCSSVIEAILDTASSIDFTRVYPMQERRRIGEVVQKPITFLGAVVKERKDLLWMVRLLLRRHEKHPEEKLNWLDPVMEGKRIVPFIGVVLERHMKEITTDIWKQLKESTSQPFPPRLRITLPCALRDTWNTSVKEEIRKEVEPEWR